MKTCASTLEEFEPMDVANLLWSFARHKKNCPKLRGVEVSHAVGAWVLAHETCWFSRVSPNCSTELEMFLTSMLVDH